MELTSCGDTITKFINTLVRDYTTSHSDMCPLRLSDLNQLKYVWYPHDASSAAIDIEPNTIYIRSADVLDGAELAEDWRLPEQVLLCEYLLQPKCFIAYTYFTLTVLLEYNVRMQYTTSSVCCSVSEV